MSTATRAEPRGFARFLTERAAATPDGAALFTPWAGGWRQTTWSELAQRSAALAAGFSDAGLARGDRAVVLVPPGVEWVAMIQALLACGAVPVLIDPGMGRTRLCAAIQRVRPRAFIAVPRAHVLRLFAPRAFDTVTLRVTVGAPRVPDTLAFGELAKSGARARPPAVAISDEDPAAILFTSGSTGPPKGVLYTHGMFCAQVRALKAMYGFADGARDLACFPLFALFNAGLGTASVLPAMDFSRPGRCDPEHLVDAIRHLEVATTFGSPAIWRRVVPWCQSRGVRLESLRALMIAGAPVEPRLVAAARGVLGPSGDVHTPYGATEALPVASIAGRELLLLRERIEGGSGNCVGRPAPGIELRLIRIDDAPLASFDASLEVRPGDPGEVCVRGAVVTREYVEEPAATSAAKIQDGATLWHRMGDVGRLDADGRLWFLGRKAHRLETAAGVLMPVPLENAFRRHPAVSRCAVVGVGARGQEQPQLVVEGRGGARLAREILAAGHGVPECAAVQRVHFKRSFPVDVRHNAKIDREELRAWAQERAR